MIGHLNHGWQLSRGRKLMKKIRYVVIMMIVSSLLLAGCDDEKGKKPNETDKPATETPVVTSTPEVTVTPDDSDNYGDADDLFDNTPTPHPTTGNNNEPQGTPIPTYSPEDTNHGDDGWSR
jgi:uncharacterized membrane protein